jgi:uncharacterized membrane protein
METDERVDVSRATQDAWAEGERWALDDPAYAELMSTYGAIGEALDEEDPSELRAALRDLWARNNALSRRCEAGFDEAWALWCAHNTTSDGGNGEQ